MSMAAAAAALPEELIEETLSRLPVKSLLRFKSASKNWYSLISQNHKFAKFHLKQCNSLSSKKNLFFYGTNVLEAEFEYSDIDSDEICKFSVPIENFVGKDLKTCRLIGSANGLICIIPIHETRCLIWNPCTGECKNIIVPFGENHTKYSIVGFGYDLVSDDYKILGDFDSCFIVFSLKTNSWKKLLDIDYDAYDYGLAGILALSSNGALHLPCFIGPKITAFDLSKDQILFLDLPQGCSYVYDTLFDYQGSLCLFDEDSGCFWLMKEYGNSNSWTKLNTPRPPIWTKPVGFSRLGEVAFAGHTIPGCGLFKSNNPDAIAPKELSFLEAVAYQESLISPRCFDQVAL